MQLIDFYKFEELFRLGNLNLNHDDEVDGTPQNQRKMSRKIETISLLEPNRLRNVGEYVANLLVLHCCFHFLCILLQELNW